MELEFERCYRAVASRDDRFDGWFVTAVSSTRIYCRPSCPAVTPKRANVRFLPSAAAAQREGYRACLRCRPDAAPGSPEWDNRADVVARAMRLIADGVVDRDGVPALGRRLGYTERHLHRMLTAELGAGPLALARAQRAQTARILVETTDLGLAEIAFAAGFGSVRQFNDTMLQVYGRQPSTLRSSAAHGGAGSNAAHGGAGSNAAHAGSRAVPGSPGAVSLRLPYRGPLHAEALLAFLALRAVPGVERVDAEGYHRTLRLPYGPGAVTLAPRHGYVQAALRLTDVRDLAPAVARCRRLLDLDADPQAVDEVLAADPALAPCVAKEPGVRLPRTVDGFELALRAVVGQQVSVAAARTLLGRLTAALGEDAGPAAGPGERAPGEDGSVAARARLFPTAEAVGEAPDDVLTMPASRRRTVRALASAVATGDLQLDGGADRAATTAALLGLPGIGAWTAGYVALRALGDPDVFLSTDLGVGRGARALGLPGEPDALDGHASRWRPWRSYAVIRLWRSS